MDLQGPDGQELELRLSDPSARLFWLPAIATGIFNIKYLEDLETETVEDSLVDQTSADTEHSTAEQICSLLTGDLQYHGPFLHSRGDPLLLRVLQEGDLESGRYYRGHDELGLQPS